MRRRKPREHFPGIGGRAPWEGSIRLPFCYTSGTGENGRVSSVGVRLEFYSRGLFLLALFLVAIAFNRNLFDPFGTPKLAAYWTLLILSFVLYSFRPKPQMPWPRIAVAVVVFGAANGVAALLSQAKIMSIFGIVGRYGGITPLVMFMSSTVFIVALYWHDPERTRHIALAVWWGAVGMATYTVIQQAGLDPYDWHQSGGELPRYPASTMGNSNFAGGFLAIALPLGVYLVASASQKRRPWLVLSLGIEVLALWYTQSRGAFIAAAVGVGTVAWISRDRAPRWMRASAYAAAAVLVVGAAAVVWHPWSTDSPSLSRVTLFDTSSAEGRIGYWKVAGQVFLDHPVVGTGPETFYATYPLYRDVSAEPSPGIADKPHNMFLEYAANTGVLGLGAYIAIIGMAIWYGYRRCRALQGEQRLLLAAFVGMLTAYVTQAAVSIDVPALALMGWVAIGAIATLADPNVLRRRATITESAPPGLQSSSNSSWRAFVFRPLFVLGAVVLLAGAFRMLRADANATLGQYHRASQLNPLQSEYPYLEGRTTLALASASEDLGEKGRYLALASTHFEKALDMRPNQWPIMLELVNMYMNWAEFIDPSRYSDAIAWSQRTLARDPTNVELRRSLDQAAIQMRQNVSRLDDDAASRPEDRMGWLRAARGHLAIGDRARASAVLGRALELDPNDQEARELLATLPP